MKKKSNGLGKITLVSKVAKPKIPEKLEETPIMVTEKLVLSQPGNFEGDVIKGNLNRDHIIPFFREVSSERKRMIPTDLYIEHSVNINKTKTTDKFASKGIIKKVVQENNWTSSLEDTNIREFLKNRKDIPNLFTPLNSLPIKRLMDSIKRTQGFKFGYSKNLLMVLKLIAFIKVSKNKRFRKYKMDLKNTDNIVAMAIIKDCSNYGVSDAVILNNYDIPKEIYENWYKYQIKKLSQFSMVQEVSNFDPFIKWALLDETNNVTFDRIIRESILQIPDNTFLKSDTLHISILKLLNVIKKNANVILYNQNNLIWDIDHKDMKNIRNCLSRSGNKFFIKKVERIIKNLYLGKELKDEFLIKIGIFLKKDELYSILKNKVKRL